MDKLLSELRRLLRGDTIHAWQVYALCKERGVRVPEFAEDLVLDDQTYRVGVHMGRHSHLDEFMRQRYFDWLCQQAVGQLEEGGMGWTRARETLADELNVPFETVRNAIIRVSKA